MKTETLNREKIDRFEDRMREIFRYERLKDCDLDYLMGQEYLIKNRMMMFKATFPDDSGVQGDLRAYVLDDQDANIEPLSEKERTRLLLLEEEIRMEIHRAIGHRKERRREQRNDFANSISDGIRGIAEAISNLFPW